MDLYRETLFPFVSFTFMIEIVNVIRGYVRTCIGFISVLTMFWHVVLVLFGDGLVKQEPVWTIFIICFCLAVGWFLLWGVALFFLVAVKRYSLEAYIDLSGLASIVSIGSFTFIGFLIRYHWVHVSVVQFVQTVVLLMFLVVLAVYSTIWILNRPTRKRKKMKAVPPLS